MLTRIYLCMLIMACFSFPLQAQNDNIWSLRKCLDYAKENNLQLQQAQLNLESSEVELARNRASRMPNLNAGVGTGANFGYAINPFTNQFVNQTTQSLNAGLSSGVTIYNGGRLTNSINQAAIDYKARSFDLEQAEYDLSLNVVLAYLNILRNAEIVESAKTQVISTKQQRDRTEKLVKAGNLAQADLLQLESQIATNELAVVNAQNLLETAYLNLMQILRLDPSQAFGIVKLELDDPEGNLMEGMNLGEIMNRANETQPFVKSAELDVESSELGVKIARSNMMPSVTASGSVGTGWASGRAIPTGEIETLVDTIAFPLSINNGEFSDARSIATSTKNLTEAYTFPRQMTDNINASVSLSLNIPIYNRRNNLSGIQQAEIQQKRAVLNAEITKQTLEQNIQQAYVNAKSALSTYSSTNKQIEALSLTFNNAEKQFNLGILNSVDYLLAKNNLDRAQNDLVQAKYDYIFRIKVLDFYLGKPLDF